MARGGVGERGTCSCRVPFADGERRPGNGKVCPESKKRWWQNQDSNSAFLHSRQKHPFWPLFSVTDEIPSLKVG